MVYISLDVEASGPLPCFYDLLSIGAVAVRKEGDDYVIDESDIYLELKPLHGTSIPEAMAVHGLNPLELQADGLELKDAAKQLNAWVRSVSSSKDRPVFVGYCANFDWAYINDFFHRAKITNPFGYRALDIRSLALGLLGLSWEQLTQDRILPRLEMKPLSDDDAHHALADARHQATMLIRLLQRSRGR